jgi:hypothetical protein
MLKYFQEYNSVGYCQNPLQAKATLAPLDKLALQFKIHIRHGTE